MVHCPSCGAGLRFEITSQQMFCEYCQNRFDPKKLYDKMSDDAKKAETFDSFVYLCPSCGGEIETTDKNDAVGFCPYCGGASMIYDKIRKEWKPDGVIPFKVTKEQCKELYCREVKKHLFVSRKYCDPQLIESFRGIYVPYCTFEGTVEGEVTLRAKSEKQNIGNYDYKTDFYDIKTTAHYSVATSQAHDASVAFDDHLSERLAPFDNRERRNFNPGYLCGFYAESGDISDSEYESLLRGEMVSEFYRAAKSDKTISEDLKMVGLKIDENTSDVVVPMQMKASKKLLYPVWFMSYRRGEKITYATVNGQTGKVAADLPLSPLRILLAALIGSAVLFGLLFLLMRILPSIPPATTLGVSAMLGFSGMYIMQHFYINTVGRALHANELTQKLPVSFILSTIGEVLGVILMTTDGTYEQNRYFIGILLLIASIFFRIRCHVVQHGHTSKIKNVQLTTDSMLSNGILVEAKKFNRINGIVRLVLFIWMGFCFSGIFSSSAAFSLMYGQSVACAIGLFVLALLHIYFQSNIAKRRLPQFNKKGAYYDTK